MKHSSPLAAPPPLLATYLDTDPAPAWKPFRSTERYAYDELCAALMGRQRGLCAFCELELMTSRGTPAREVEHWRPKSLDVPPSVEHTFGIGNLQLGCFGGSRRHPVEDVAHTADPMPRPNASCGAAKGSLDPDDGVDGVGLYRPQDLPEDAILFTVDQDGWLGPDPGCTALGFDPAKLMATITFLGLNCTRLRNARSAIRKALDETFELYLSEAPGDDEDAHADAAILLLAQDTAPASQDDLPRFVTTLRAYFGRAFDKVLFPTPGWSVGV